MEGKPTQSGRLKHSPHSATGVPEVEGKERYHYGNPTTQINIMECVTLCTVNVSITKELKQSQLNKIKDI